MVESLKLKKCLKTCLKAFLKSLKIVGEFVLKFDLKIFEFEFGFEKKRKKKEKKQNLTYNPASTRGPSSFGPQPAHPAASLPPLSLSATDRWARPVGAIFSLQPRRPFLTWPRRPSPAPPLPAPSCLPGFPAPLRLPAALTHRHPRPFHSL
jgi:hypothetical protein